MFNVGEKKEREREKVYINQLLKSPHILCAYKCHTCTILTLHICYKLNKQLISCFTASQRVEFNVEIGA